MKPAFLSQFRCCLRPFVCNPASHQHHQMTPSRQFLIQTFCFKDGARMDAADAASSCKAVTDAIRDIYAQDMENIGFGDLYRRAYNLVLYGHGELLYSEVETAMTAEVEGLARSLAAVTDGGGEFLQELMSKWRLHKQAVTTIRDIVMYMDRTFVIARAKVSVHDLGVKLWRDGVVCSGDVLPRLVEAVRRVRAAAEPGDVMAGVDKMLTELGDEVHRRVMDGLDASSADDQ